MKRFLALFLIAVMVITVVSCGDDTKGDETSVVSEFDFNEGYVNSDVSVNPDDPFTGKWANIYEDDVMIELYTFYGNGTGIVEITDIVYRFDYLYDDETLTIRDYPDTLDEYVEKIYTYKIEDKQLFLKSTTTDHEFVWHLYEE